MLDANKTVTFPLLGDPNRKLSVWLFRQVANSKQIQESIVAGELVPELAFINASLVPGLIVLQAAAQKAVAAQLHGALRTRSLHAEVVFNIAGSKHVGEGLKRFGIGEGCSDVLVASLNPEIPNVATLQKLVDGDLTELETLPTLTDAEALQKIYKITPPELEVGTLTDAICCRIAASHC